MHATRLAPLFLAVLALPLVQGVPQLQVEFTGIADAGPHVAAANSTWLLVVFQNSSVSGTVAMDGQWTTYTDSETYVSQDPAGNISNPFTPVGSTPAQVNVGGPMQSV